MKEAPFYFWMGITAAAAYIALSPSEPKSTLSYQQRVETSQELVAAESSVSRALSEAYVRAGAGQSSLSELAERESARMNDISRMCIEGPNASPPVRPLLEAYLQADILRECGWFPSENAAQRWVRKKQHEPTFMR